jgi:hypothetical protein
MARGKSSKLKPFQKLLTIMVSGKPVTIDEIDATLGKEIYMYRLSTYIWHIKTQANGIVKAVKDGRKVSAYQIVNVDEVKEYMKRSGITSANFVPGQAQKVVRAKKNAAAAPVQKLADLNAQPEVVAEVEEMKITEVTENEVA